MPARGSGSSAAQLNYVIAARDAQFQRVADRVTKRLERIEKGGKAAARGTDRLHKSLTGLAAVKTLGGGLVSGLTFASLTRAIEQSVAAVDALGKTSQAIDIPFRDFQLLSQLAREAGIETTKVAKALLAFTRRSGNALLDGTYAKVFKELGVDLRDSNGAARAHRDLLLEISGRLQKIPEAAVQVEYLDQLFSQTGRTAREFILGLSTTLPDAEKGVITLTERTRELAATFQTMRDRADHNIATALDEALVRLDNMLGVSQSISDLWNRVAEAIRFATDHGPFSANPQARSVTPFTAAAPASSPAVSRPDTPPVDPVTRSRFHPGQLPQHLRATGRTEETPSRQTGPVGRLAGTSPRDLRRQARSIEFGKILERQAESRESAVRDAQNLENKLAEARRQEYLDEEARLMDLTRQREQAAEVQEALERAGHERARQRLSSTIGGFIRNLGSLDNAFSSLLNSIANALIDKLAGSLTSSLLSSAGGSLLTGLFGFADGGSVRRGHAVLVGERGPEIFTPRTSGSIIPNEALRSSSGAPVVNLTFNIESTDGPGVRAAIREAEPRLISGAVSAVAVQQSRPGTALARQNRQAP